MPRKPHGTARSAVDRRSKTEGHIGDARSPAAHTFLVRLWKETRDDAHKEPIWRGTVSTLRGRQLGSFSSTAELMGILGDMLRDTVLLRVSCGGMTAERPLGDAP